MVSALFTEAAGLLYLILIPEVVVVEFVYVLAKVYGRSADTIRSMLKALTSTAGVEFLGEYDLRDVLSLWPETVKDFSDAIIAVQARNEDAPVFTFDESLKKELQRLGIPVAVRKS